MGGEVIALDAAKIDRVPSLAVRGQAPLTLGTTFLKVAVPESAVNVTVPERAHGDVMLMTSDDPAPFVSTLPYASSTVTTKGAAAVPAVTSPGEGHTVKARCDGGPGERAVDELTAINPSSGAVVSVAITVQDGPVSMVTDGKVATPLTAVSVSELDCDKAHEEPIVMSSVDPGPEVTVW